MSESVKFIPLSIPNFCGNEKKYIDEALDGAWVSTSGARVNDFEKVVADYLSMPSSVACSSGTSALHLSAIVCGIQRGDEVIVPAVSFIASVNPTTRYMGAEPVFIGCDETATIDPGAVRAFCVECCEMKDGKLYNIKTGAHVGAIVVVHTFGNMADMERLMPIAKEFNLIVIEDACEAIGTKYTEGTYTEKFAGTIGDIGTFSYNGNKIITTGTGGSIVSNHEDWTARAKHLSTQAKTDLVRFYHDEVGYNYRMTNIDACLGIAQMELLESFIDHKIMLYNHYCMALKGINGFDFLPFREGTRSNHWFFSLLLPDRLDRDDSMKRLSAKQIQSRPVWGLLNEQCDYGRNEAHSMETAERLYKKILNIPCSTNVTLEDADRVIEEILAL